MQGSLFHKILHEIKIAIIFFVSQLLFLSLVFGIYSHIYMIFGPDPLAYSLNAFIYAFFAWAYYGKIFIAMVIIYLPLFVTLNFIKKEIPFKINALSIFISYIIVMLFVYRRGTIMEAIEGYFSLRGLILVGFLLAMQTSLYYLYRNRKFLKLSEAFGFE